MIKIHIYIYRSFCIIIFINIVYKRKLILNNMILDIKMYYILFFLLKLSFMKKSFSDIILQYNDK